MSKRDGSIRLVLALAAGLVLAGCGGAADQDAGGGEDAALSGVGVDGYLARATVWVDLDEDGQIDSFEPRALTDDAGYFSYNPVTGADYCRSDAPAVEARHCLRDGPGDGARLLRMSGGYDTTTGEAFDGMLSLRAAGQRSGLVVSPLASLLSSAGGDRREALLRKLPLSSNSGAGITAEDLATDFFADLDDPTNVDMLVLALQAHKAVSAMADLLESRYDRLGEDSALPPNAGGPVYDALVSELLAGSTDFAVFVADAAALEAVIARAEALIRALYNQAGLTLPAPLSQAAAGQRAAAVARLAMVVQSVVDNVIRDDSLPSDREQRARGVARAVEVVLRKMLRGDPDFNDAADWAERQSADVAALGGGGKDLTVLVEGDMDPDNANHSNDAEIPADALRLTNFINGRLTMSHSAGGRSGAVIMYFLGQHGASAGDWRVCLRYSGNEDLDTDGLYLDGDWALMDADNPYLMLVSAEILGNDYAMAVRSVDVNAQNQAVFRFDYDDTTSDLWTGDPAVGAIDTAAIPADNEACRDALNQAFGPI